MRRRDSRHVLAGFVLVCLSVGWLGALSMTDSSADWYRSLNKPAWTPPNWVFGPVWTALYVCMGLAGWLVWRRGGRQAVPALGLFAVQLAFNGLWTPLFFGMRRPGLALIDLAALWATLVAATVVFWRRSRPAGLLMAPYLLWVSFAAALNWAIWRLNV